MCFGWVMHYAVERELEECCSCQQAPKNTWLGGKEDRPARRWMGGRCRDMKVGRYPRFFPS